MSGASTETTKARARSQIIKPSSGAMEPQKNISVDRVFENQDNSTEEPERTSDGSLSPKFPVLENYLRLANFGTSVMPMNSLQWESTVLAFSGYEPFIYYSALPGGVEVEKYLDSSLRPVRCVISKEAREYLLEGSEFHVYCFTDQGTTTMITTAKTQEIAERVGGELFRSIDEDCSAKGDDFLPVEFWRVSSDEAKSKHRVIDTQEWSKIRDNYTAPVQKGIEDAIGTSPRELSNGIGKILVWHGPPGTGKTYAVRALMSAWMPWCDSKVILDPARAIQNRDFFEDLILFDSSQTKSDAWKLWIIEDANVLFEPDPYDRNGGIIGKLLSCSDGLLGQGSRSMFLITTNLKESAIPPSLLRPGRCLSKVTFEPFSPLQAQGWLGDNFGRPQKSLPLAKLFEIKRGRSPVPLEAKVGESSPGPYL